jgi:hypothetical protein
MPHSIDQLQPVTKSMIRDLSLSREVPRMILSDVKGRESGDRKMSSVNRRKHERYLYRLFL